MDRELPSPAARADMLEAQEMLDPTFPRICVLPIYVGRSVKAALAAKEALVEDNIIFAPGRYQALLGNRWILASFCALSVHG